MHVSSRRNKKTQAFWLQEYEALGPSVAATQETPYPFL